jgi:hypothetical protein
LSRKKLLHNYRLTFNPKPGSLDRDLLLYYDHSWRAVDYFLLINWPKYHPKSTHTLFGNQI